MRSLKEMTWTELVVLGGSLSAATFSLYLLYFDNDEELLPESSGLTITSRQTVIEVKIPKDMAGHVIGPQGTVVKRIQAESGARIHFKDEATTETHRFLMVRGSQESAQKAEVLIKQIINDVPEILKIELKVPQHFLGRLIGRNGDNIRALQRSSNAKVIIERTSDERDPKAPKKVTITGAAEHIEAARGLIEEQMEKEEAFRQKQRFAAESRGKRDRNKTKATTATTTTSAAASSGNLDYEGEYQDPRIEIQGSNGSCCPFHAPDAVDGSGDAEKAESVRTPVKLPAHHGFFDVYVSALDSREANRLWIQLGRQTEKLNALNDDLSLLYNSPAGDEFALRENVREGDLVAAKLNAYSDVKWFRATVKKVLNEPYKLEVFYLDYGDVAVVESSDARHLKDEFASWPAQAVECLLANVQSVSLNQNSEGEAVWSNDALDFVDARTYNAQWVLLYAKIVGGKVIDGCKLPLIELIDTNGPEDVNVAQSLVEAGHARFVETG